jgi:O-antigen/teichoic acid export membrane protein
MDKTILQGLKSKAISGSKFKFLENIFLQFISLFSQLIITRLLTPTIFGNFYFSLIFIEIIASFLYTIFSFPIISSEESNPKFLNTLFLSAVITSSLFYIILNIFIFMLVDNSFLTLDFNTFIFLSLVIFFRGFTIIQISILTKEISFKSIFIGKIISSILNFLLALLISFSFFRDLTLTVSFLISELIFHILIFFSSKWKPTFLFSFAIFLKTLKYSFFYSIVNLMSSFQNHIKSFLIGNSFSIQTLAFYSKGIHLPSLLMTQTDGTINSIAIPIFSQIKDKQDLLSAYRSSLTLSFTIVYPMLIGLYVISEQLIGLIYGSDWLEASLFLKIYIVVVSTWPFSLRSHLFNSIGKTRLNFWFSFFENALTLLFIFISIKNLNVILLSSFFSALIFLVIGGGYLKKMITYSFCDQIFDFIKPVSISLLMGILLYLINFNLNSDFLNLILNIFTGFLLYLLFSIVFNRKPIKSLFGIIKKYFEIL